MNWTLLRFYSSKLLICWRPVITLFARVCICVSLCNWWSEAGRGKKVEDLFKLVLLRDDSIPQSSNWWIFGPLEGGHTKRSEHPRWGWHDSHFTGCIPRTHRCPSAYMQQRVSLIHSSKSLVFLLMDSLLKYCNNTKFLEI